MQRCDVLVVGGGPAGSATALRLAEAGASVVLADRATFPRDKPCGGGLTMRAVRHCPVDPDPVVEERVDTVELRFRYDDVVVRRAREPVILMTQRRRLDAFLLDAAREQGVEVREGVRVTFDDGRPRIDGEPVEAELVVGADGANGVTARAFGLGEGIVRGVAYEGNVDHRSVDAERYRGRAVVELADIPGGYAWVFPKGDHVNVGVGAWAAEGPRLREHLRRLCDAHGLRLEDVEQLRGHRLPLRRPGTRVATGRALLVGDAAGLVDPVSGDGMYECFVSAKLASAAILDVLSGAAPSLQPYAPALDAALSRLHRASWTLKRALDRWPRASWRIARTQLLWRSVEKLLLGELSAPGEQRGVARAPLRLLDLLGRLPA
ncbi:MAG TPA: geranylgeranyl reductase family protein [Gaiellaceae bacterium]|nr:geranylgeranyl reductase family protein [Gaiellaceae bacterium]